MVLFSNAFWLRSPVRNAFSLRSSVRNAFLLRLLVPNAFFNRSPRHGIYNSVCLNENEAILKQNKRNALPFSVERQTQMFNIGKKTEKRRNRTNNSDHSENMKKTMVEGNNIRQDQNTNNTIKSRKMKWRKNIINIRQTNILLDKNRLHTISNLCHHAFFRS